MKDKTKTKTKTPYEKPLKKKKEDKLIDQKPINLSKPNTLRNDCNGYDYNEYVFFE